MVFAERCIISPVIAQEHREYRHWSNLRRIVEATLVESRVSAPVRGVVVCGVVGVRPLRSGRRGRQGEQEAEKETREQAALPAGFGSSFRTRQPSQVPASWRWRSRTGGTW